MHENGIFFVAANIFAKYLEQTLKVRALTFLIKEYVKKYLEHQPTYTHFIFQYAKIKGDQYTLRE